MPAGGGVIHALQIVFYGTGIDYYIDGNLFQSHPSAIAAPVSGDIILIAQGTSAGVAGWNPVMGWDVDYVRWTNDITAY